MQQLKSFSYNKEETQQDDPLVRHLAPKQKKHDIMHTVYPPPFPNQLPIHPFSLLIAGKGRSGKTTMCLGLLTKRDFYFNYFNRFIIVSPNIHQPQWERTLEKLKDKVDIFDSFDDKTEQTIDSILRLNRDEIRLNGRLVTPKILIIFDDMIDNKRLRGSQLLDHIMTRGRHSNLSVIFCTQVFNRFPLQYRKLLTNVISYGTANEKEVETLADEFCHKELNHDQFKRVFDYATKKPYDFFHIDTRAKDDKDMYRHNFCETLHVIPRTERNVGHPIPGFRRSTKTMKSIARIPKPLPPKPVKPRPYRLADNPIFNNLETAKLKYLRDKMKQMMEAKKNAKLTLKDL